MKVKRLYVLCLDNWSLLGQSDQAKEINGGVKALCEKYVLRLGADSVCRINYRTQKFMGPLVPERTFEKLKEDQNTGMYVFGHTEGSAASTVGGYDPTQLAGLIKSLDIKIRKLCLIACCAAAGHKEKKQENFTQGNPSYLTQLCEALKMDGLKIAGWTEFVSVCQEERPLYRSRSKKFTEEEKKAYELVKGEPKVSLLGKKVIQATVERLVRPQDRQSMKCAYVWMSGKVEVATHTWHDTDWQ